jgi:hypothetical protein
MGDGTAMGIQSPKQNGVITKEGENFPHIPEKLLKLSPQEIQGNIDKIIRLQELNRMRILPDIDRQEKLEDAHFLLLCAKTAVERQRKSAERE